MKIEKNKYSVYKDDKSIIILTWIIIICCRILKRNEDSQTIKAHFESVQQSYALTSIVQTYHDLSFQNASILKQAMMNGMASTENEELQMFLSEYIGNIYVVSRPIAT